LREIIPDLRGRRIIVFLLLASAGMAIADAPPSRPSVMAVVSPAAGADDSLRGVLFEAVQVQLLRRNAPIVRAGQETAGRTTAELMPVAAGQGARYLLVCAYSTVGRRLSLRAELLDTLSSVQVGAGQSEGRVDLSLDDVVARALEGALAGVTFPAEPVPQEPAPQEPVHQEPVQQEQPPAEQPPAAAAAQAAGRQRRVGISAGAAPMIPTGPAAGYTDLGLLATAAFELRFPLRVGTLSAGILSGACLFSAEGASSEAFVAIVPLGLEAGWRLGGDGIGLGLRIGGGPALMVTSAPAVSTLLKIVPYALAGMALELPFSPALGLSLKAGYAVFFESATLPIMAFAPEVLLYARF
jgi:hypothetical protein